MTVNFIELTRTTNTGPLFVRADLIESVEPSYYDLVGRRYSGAKIILTTGRRHEVIESHLDVLRLMAEETI